MHKKKTEERLVEMLGRDVRTWEDFYKKVGQHAEGAVQTCTTPMVFGTMFLMYAFMQARRQLPDEGDIQVLVRRTAYVLAHERADKLGASIEMFLSSPDMEQSPASATDYSDMLDSAERPPRSTLH